MNAWQRLLAALVLVGVLADASACSGTFSPPDSTVGRLAISASCPCGCSSHSGPPAGIGLGQFAVPPAEIIAPVGVRHLPVRALVPRIARPPLRSIDHVPIALA